MFFDNDTKNRQKEPRLFTWTGVGQLEKCELNTLRWRLFSRAAVWSRAQGKPTLKLAVRGEENRNWWREILHKLTALPNCNAVGSLPHKQSTMKLSPN
jgi:hypothetical protein